MVLIHLTSGLPARGTELLTIRTRNTAKGGLRGLFIENSLISLVTQYYKNYTTTAKLKIIHRYIASDISQLLIYYLWLVEPFSYRLGVFLEETSSENTQNRSIETYRSAFLWPEKARSRPNLDFYQVRKRPRRNTEAIDELDPDLDLIETSTSTKSTDSLPFWISLNSWTSGQLSQLIQREFKSRLGLKISLIKWRHIIIAIFRKFNSDPKIAKLLAPTPRAKEGAIGEEEGDSESDLDFNLDLDIAINQSGHSLAISEQIYGRDISELPGQTSTKRAIYRLTSCWLHRFLGLESASPIATRSIENENKRLRLKKWRKYQKIDLVAVLK